MKFTNETQKRMLRTFIQAFCGALAGFLSSLAVSDDYKVAVGACVGLAVCEAITAIMNLETDGESESEPDETEEKSTAETEEGDDDEH